MQQLVLELFLQIDKRLDRLRLQLDRCSELYVVNELQVRAAKTLLHMVRNCQVRLPEELSARDAERAQSQISPQGFQRVLFHKLLFCCKINAVLRCSRH